MYLNMYLSLDGIMGEATSPLGAGWIELLSYSHGTQPPAPADPSVFGFTARVDRSYGSILHACVSGRPIRRARIGAWRNGNQFEDIRGEDGIVTSAKLGGGLSGPRYMEFSVKFRTGWITGRNFRGVPWRGANYTSNF